MKYLIKFSFFSFSFLVLLSLLVVSCKKEDNSQANEPEIVFDIESNMYHTVKIGTQIWMVENLRTRTYNDGDTIPMLMENSSSDTTPRYIWYDNDQFKYIYAYGALYNWYTVKTGKLAPKGWHIPTYNEWLTLINYLGGDSVAGGKMKTTGDLQHGTGLWSGLNIGATNESGFSAFPSGECMKADSIWFIGGSVQGFWWSSTSDHDFPWSFWVANNHVFITNSHHYPEMLNSVRCIKD